MLLLRHRENCNVSCVEGGKTHVRYSHFSAILEIIPELKI
jgi:hypothetical protein